MTSHQNPPCVISRGHFQLGRTLTAWQAPLPGVSHLRSPAPYGLAASVLRDACGQAKPRVDPELLRSPQQQTETIPRESEADAEVEMVSSI